MHGMTWNKLIATAGRRRTGLLALADDRQSMYSCDTKLGMNIYVKMALDRRERLVTVQP